LQKRRRNTENLLIRFSWKNRLDTSCLSSEIVFNKSVSIHTKWLKSHKSGRYFLNKTEWMDTEGFVGVNNSDGTLSYAMGGSFSDSVLLADKWYKFIPKKLQSKK
jgi:hypothetical protein